MVSLQRNRKPSDFRSVAPRRRILKAPMPYMTTEQSTKWAEEQEAELAERRPRTRPRQAMQPSPTPVAGALLGSPEHEYVKGGRLPLGFRRVWASPQPGARPVATGIEVDPEGAVLVRDVLPTRARRPTLKQVSEALSRQYGAASGSRGCMRRSITRSIAGRRARSCGSWTTSAQGGSAGGQAAAWVLAAAPI